MNVKLYSECESVEVTAHGKAFSTRRRGRSQVCELRGGFIGFASAADLGDSRNRWFDVAGLVAQSLEGWIWWTVGSGYAGRGSTSSLVHEAPRGEEDT